MPVNISESTQQQETISKTMLKDTALFRQQCYINGEWVDADSKATIVVTNPADNAILGSVPRRATIALPPGIRADLPKGGGC